jgi:hypothetical protein
MDDVTRKAVRAFYRLHKATAAVASDPHHPGALDALQNTGNEAHAAMRTAGLIGVPPNQLFDLVRELYPDFDLKD